MTLLVQQLVNGVMVGCVYVMVAVAFTLTIGILNFLNFTIPTLVHAGGGGGLGNAMSSGLRVQPSCAAAVAPGAGRRGSWW